LPALKNSFLSLSLSLIPGVSPYAGIPANCELSDREGRASPSRTDSVPCLRIIITR
jgi:hypothetical protein